MILAPMTTCIHCEAQKFQYEPPSFYCANGEVKIVVNVAPKALKNLFLGHNEDSINFKTYSRLYNNLFAFSSLGGHIQCQCSEGIYVFELHGQIYHFLPSLVPFDQGPKYLQLYFYDTEHEHENSSGLFPELRPTVIAKLMHILQNNPYAQFFQSLRYKTIDEYTTIRINKNPSLDQRVYNAPVSSEAAGILLDSTTSSESAGPYIVVSGKENRSYPIMHYYGCYVLLQYPLLFSLGESGWCPGLKRAKRNSGHSTLSRSAPVASAQTAEELLLEEDAGMVSWTYTQGDWALVNVARECVGMGEGACFREKESPPRLFRGSRTPDLIDTIV